MRSHHDRVQSVLYVLGYLLKECDKDGMDMYFTVSLERCNSKNSSGLLQNYRSAAHQGTSDLGSRLSTILHGYEEKLRHHKSKRRSLFGSKTMKPMNVYILTDAVWQPLSNAAQPIKSMVETLGELHYPSKQVGIQFIHFGNDPACFRKLQRLDSGLGLPMYVLSCVSCNDTCLWANHL